MKLVASITLIGLLAGAYIEEKDFGPDKQFLLMVAVLACVYFFGWAAK